MLKWFLCKIAFKQLYSKIYLNGRKWLGSLEEQRHVDMTTCLLATSAAEFDINSPRAETVELFVYIHGGLKTSVTRKNNLENSLYLEIRSKCLYIWKEMFLSRSQAIEFFLLPAVPTEHLDELRQPHFPTSPNSVDLDVADYLYLQGSFESIRSTS